MLRQLLRTCLFLVLANLLTQTPPGCHAQIYTFKHTPLPTSKTLQTLYSFYVYSLDEAPEIVDGAPFVEFSGLYVYPRTGSSSSNSSLGYRSVQVSILRYREFWSLLSPTRFCGSADDVKKGLVQAPDTLMLQKSSPDVYRHTAQVSQSGELGFGAGDSEKITIGRSGLYVLVLSNCGDFTDADLTGSVIVKNSYGFLPGIEYHKMPFYMWLFRIYAGLAILWMSLSVRWWKELSSIQSCIAGVIFLSLIESFIWYIFYSGWNDTGTRGEVTFVISILFTVMKNGCSYMLVLVASLGWGVTTPYLHDDVLRKVKTLAFLYIVLSFIREAVLSFRHSHSLSFIFVVLCLMPVSLVNAAIFYWVFTALSSLITTLQERRQTEKLLLFERLWKILVFALACATITVFFQVFDFSRSDTSGWRYQWLFADAISHILFLVVLVAMVYLWAPHKYSQRFAYSAQIEGKDIEDAKEDSSAIWADDDVLDDGEEEEDVSLSFWSATKGGLEAAANGVAADVIGAPSTSISERPIERGTSRTSTHRV